MIHNYHYVAENLSEAAVLALNAGIDVEWPSVMCYGDPLKAALEAGDINIEMVDLAIERHLKMKFALGLFENPYVDEGAVAEVFETAENRALARKIAQQSIVLLKNDGILPLGKDIKKVALIGPSADDGRMQLGDYSYVATRELVIIQQQQNSMFHHLDSAWMVDDAVEIVTILDGLKTRFGEQVEVRYAKGCDALSDDTSGIPDAVEVSKWADLTVMVLGDKSGLTPDCSSGETRDVSDLRLPGVQQILADAVLETGKPVVVVLTSGRPYEIEPLTNKANAVLQAWLPGEEGGNAIADIMFGDVNPGGRLPVTFPR
jgi:beta-glucosidase